MDRQEFLQQHADIAEETVVQAWEQSGGDPDQAEEFLDPRSLYVKGRVFSPGESLSGLFLVQWEVGDQRTEEHMSVVYPRVDTEDVSLTLPVPRFRSKIQEILDSDRVMGVHSDELESVLSQVWGETSRELRSLLESSRFEQLEDLHERNLKHKMDIEDLRVRIEVETKRRIHDPETSGETSPTESEEIEERVLKCEARVDPVKGVPVQKLREGDGLLVHLSEDATPGGALRGVLEKRRDEKHGMIPSRIVSRRTTDTGRVHFRVQFGKKVYGELMASGDVSLSVPGDSEEKSPTGGSRATEGVVEVLQSRWYVVVGLVIIVLLVLYFLM